ncbi:TonB-dependent receptor [Phenylobacterium sp.]|uniref:TonB-dependent receptor n=1 Tax=Phenylobacterium sp. TaxID=1871053 RepID=UPI0035AEBB1A
MRQHLLLGAAIGALLATAGQAAAEEADSTAAAGADAEVSELVVYGQGETRQVQAIKPQEIEQAAPGTSPIKLVEKLPGVNFQSSDPFGAYEWSTRISIRGFNQNQLGFTLDGVPLGDMSYGAFNGLHISRAISNEDIGGVELAQGAGTLETASTSNLGGTLKFLSRDPSHEMGGQVQVTGGSSNTWRGYVRFETGDLPTGGRAYISYTDQNADKWKGEGKQKQKQIDFKFVQPIGSATLTGFYDWSRRRENDYQDLSKGMISRLGYDWDNITGDWAKAVAVAETYLANPAGDCSTNAYPSPIQCVDDAYYNASGLRNDDLWALTLDAPFGDNFKASATVYGHTNDGQGTWYTPYVPSPNYGVAGATTDNAPISVRTTEYSIDRTGLVANADWTLGAHTISFGGWYEDNDFNQYRRYYGLDLASPKGNLSFFSNPFYTQWGYAFNTKTAQGYIQDLWEVNDALKVNFGFKAVRVKSTSDTVVAVSPQINGSITSEDSFLPQVGVNYRFAEGQEFFADYAENMRAFGAAHTGLSPFATTQDGFNAIVGKLQPESSKTIEAGWRFRFAQVQGVLAAYYVKFDDRLIGTSAGSGIVGNPTILANAGSVTSKGFEAAATWRFADAWSLFGSYAYNDSQYDDDIVDSTGAVTQHISGKTVVDAPKHLANAELAFDQDGWFAKLSAHYTSKRFYTYTNDQSVGGVVTADLSAGYRFDGEGWMKGLEVQANVTNLFDKKYVSTLGSNGFGYSGDAQTLQAAAPRQVFVTVRKAF